ncbi:glycosyltransferase [Alphaproteobacteria bacterium]|nr:glycosyltransferase [Alphaproteobacteria bacterium]
MSDSDNTPMELFAAADAAAARGEIDLAIEMFREVARRAPGDSASLTRAGHLLLRVGRPEEARVVLDLALSRYPDNATAWFLIGEAQELEKDVDAARRAFKQVIRLRPNLPLAHFRLGQLSRNSGAVATAIPAFREAARLQPDNVRHHAELASVLYEARLTEEAVTAFKKQTILAPEDPEGHYNIAIALPLLGAREAGLREFRRTTTLDPLSDGAWSRIARLSERLVPGADTSGPDRRAMVLAPDDHEPLLRRAASGTTLAMGLIFRRRVLVLAPDILANRVRLARLLLKVGKFREVMTLLRSVVDVPRPAEAAVDAYRRACVEAREPLPTWCRTAYQRWLSEFEPGARRETAEAVISVVMPVCDPPIEFLRHAINSVITQKYPNWQLCIADDASRDPQVRGVLEVAARDPRVQVTFRQERGHISAASNTALETATGDIICFLDHDDLLASNALGCIGNAFHQNPDLGMVYSDEDKIDKNGVRFDPHFKPDWNLDLLLSQNYLCHLMSIRRSLVETAGGFTLGMEGSQDHDLALRVAEVLRPEQIGHIRQILYHWRALPGSTAMGADAKPYAAEATRKTLQAYHDRRGGGGHVRTVTSGWHTTWPLPSNPPIVSVIVPTRDRGDLLRRCVDGLRGGTRYPSVEVLVVDNGSREPDCLEYLDQLRQSGEAVVLNGTGPFNFSTLNNQAVRAAHGQVLCFINNDVEPLTPDWLWEMVAHALRPDIGVVGAKLLYPNRRIQHGGIILCGDHVARHLHVGLDEDAQGYWGRAASIQSLAAVTGACMVVRKEVFEAVDGFDEAWPVDFGDIDFCLRAGAAGYRTLWTPHALLLHHESASRGTFFTKAKEERYKAGRQAMVARWGKTLMSDPHYHPNLSIDPKEEPFDLAFPPREAF